MTLASGATIVISPIAAHALAVLAEFLNLLPLLRRQLGAKLKQEPGIRLFQLGPGLGHAIDLR